MPRDCWLSLLGAMFLRLLNMLETTDASKRTANRAKWQCLTEDTANGSVWEIYG